MIYNIGHIINPCPTKRQIDAMEDAVQYMNERKQKRFATFKEKIKSYWQLYPWMMVVVMVVVVVFTSCRSQQYIVPNDTITTTTTKMRTIERDSIYLHDSIYIREYMKGDTVFLEKLVEHFKDRWLTRTDTLRQQDTITITKTTTKTETKEVKHVPKFYKWCTGLFWLLVIGWIIKIILRFVK